jgi:predicted nucleic acid-binding protein
LTALIDTNVAIHLRDGDVEVIDRFSTMTEPPWISIITRVELEGGVVAVPALAQRRRAALDALLQEFRVLDFDAAALASYAEILAVTGFSRPRILDRMIAATALAHRAALVTMNAQDFRDIPRLDLIEWRQPA